MKSKIFQNYIKYHSKDKFKYLHSKDTIKYLLLINKYKNNKFNKNNSANKFV